MRHFSSISCCSALCHASCLHSLLVAIELKVYNRPAPSLHDRTGNRKSNRRLIVPKRRKKKLLDRVRDAIRTRHYSIRTEEAYVSWIKRFILFHQKRHPQEMGAAEIEEFLTCLAVDKNVAASTQNQALSALLFLYQKVLKKELERSVDAVRAKKPGRLPTVLTREEAH